MTDRKEIEFYKWFDDHGWEIKDFHSPVDFKTLGAISKVGYNAGYDARNAEVEEFKQEISNLKLSCKAMTMDHSEAENLKLQALVKRSLPWVMETSWQSDRLGHRWKEETIAWINEVKEILGE